MCVRRFGLLCFLVSLSAVNLQGIPQNENSGMVVLQNRDVVKKERPQRNPGQSLRSSHPLWQGSVVPYIMEPNLDENLRRIMLGAMGEISTRTCLRFKPRWSSETTYLDIFKGSSCEISPRNTNGVKLTLSGHCLSHRRAVALLLASFGAPVAEIQEFVSSSSVDFKFYGNGSGPLRNHGMPTLNRICS